MSTLSHSKVLVTGGSGFVATHILDLLLKRGYNVKTTIRSQEKADYLATKFGSEKLEFSIVKDMQTEGAFDKTLEDDKEITAVIHTASPFFFASSDPLNNLINPAINGTKNILKAIKAHAPQVNTVVITSSYAAIANVEKRYDPSFVHTEETWADMSMEDAINDLSKSYRGSKKYAEKAFWEFIETNKPNFTGTTVNPPMIYGPLLQQVKSIDELNTSSKLLLDMVFNTDPSEDPTDKYAKDPNIWADVRDVAFAHVAPLENKKLAGKRLFVTPGFYSNQTVLDIVNKNFPSLQGKIAKGIPGTGDKYINTVSQYDNHVTNELLGIKYHTLEETIVDSFKSLIELKEKSN